MSKPTSGGNQAFKAFVDASAGAMGALFAAVLLYPLDVVKTRQQVAQDADSKSDTGADGSKRDDGTRALAPKPRQRNMWLLCWAIYRHEGLEGLFAGLSSKMAHTVFSSFAYFYWYSFLKQATERRTGHAISTGANLLVAALAGALNMSMTLPLEMINTRAQITDDDDSEDDSAAQKPAHKSTWAIVQEIYAENGVLSFWKGYVPSLVLVSNPSINYTVFDSLKLRVQQWKQQRTNAKRLVALTMLEAFVLAAVAKAIATIITYPVIRAKVLMQAQKKTVEDGDKSSITSTHAASTETRWCRCCARSGRARASPGTSRAAPRSSSTRCSRARCC
ncbi:hypothetical protein PINS_up011223 [Pythium insidiosum]|nr:hypothetical protein PINS_up011223 [Pythium insidiosum]